MCVPAVPIYADALPDGRLSKFGVTNAASHGSRVNSHVPSGGSASQASSDRELVRM
jgi:hypothetical protein